MKSKYIIGILIVGCRIIYPTDIALDSTLKKSEPYAFVYLGIASGFKYQSIGGIIEEGIAPSFLLSVLTNTNEDESNFLGVELKYYRYGYDTRNHITNVFFLTPFYQWDSKLFSGINLILQIGVTALSNNTVLFFTNSFDIGVKFQLINIDIFVKNNVNINYLLLTNIVSITNVGVYIKL